MQGKNLYPLIVEYINNNLEEYIMDLSDEDLAEYYNIVLYIIRYFYCYSDTDIVKKIYLKLNFEMNRRLKNPVINKRKFKKYLIKKK